jgi:tetratricopeptide (TPR) repeat protein
MNRLSNLLGEIHRRSVWQILGSYAVGAWIILQLAETLAGLIGLPLWFGPTVVTLTILGFPLLLLTTFLQGGGEKKEEKDKRDGPGKAFLRRLFSWRNAAMTAGAVVVLLGLGTAGYTGMRAAGIEPVGSLMAQGIIESEERLILAEFADRTPDGTLGETVTALFRIDLAQSTSVQVLEPAQLTPALTRMQRDPSEALTQEIALEVAQREGIKGVITGEVLPLGNGAVISARLMTATGESLVALDQTARDVAEIPEAVDDLSARLRERIGESLRAIQGDPPLNEVTTVSLEALRKYAQAERANDQGDWERAATLLQEALEEDSTFSMAWRKQGILYQNENRDPDRAQTSFRKAYEGRNRLTDRERYLTEAAYFTYVEVDQQRAIQAYEAVLEDYPNDRIATNNLAVAYGDMGEGERAADLYLRSIRGGVAPAVTYSNAAETLFDLGWPDSTAAVLDLFVEAYPENPTAHNLSAALASARFDYDQAEAHTRAFLEAQVGNPGAEMGGLAQLASYAVLQGEVQDALDLIMRAFDKQEMIGASFIPQPRDLFYGLIKGMIEVGHYGDHEAAVATLNETWARRPTEGVEPETLDHLQFAVLYAQAGRPDRAREMVGLYQAEVDPEVRASDGQQSRFHLTLGAIALAEGRPEEGLSETLRARELVEGCVLCVLPELGEAYGAVGRHREAVESFTTYLESPVLRRVDTDNVNLFGVLLGSARSYEALGENEKAADRYRWLLDLWSEADLELQPRIEELRAALARVEGS